MLPKIFIIILNWNGKKDTLACLSSIQSIDYPNFEVVVVDNGSTDDSAFAIRKQFPSIILLETGKNLGYAAGNNVGIDFALKQETDLILLLNNDTVVDSQILKEFVNCLTLYPNCGILGAKVYLFEERCTMDHLGGVWNRKKIAFDYVGWRQVDDGKSWEEVLPIDYVCGASILIQREVFEKIGFLEPKFFLLWEESDFCFRAKGAGFLPLICPKAKVWHKVHASFIGGKPHTTYFHWRNRLLWIERNLPFFEKCMLFTKLAFSIFNIFKLKTFQTFQLYLFKPLLKSEKIKKKHEIIKVYKAALSGVKDYLFRNFGDGPHWIYRNTQTELCEKDIRSRSN